MLDDEVGSPDDRFSHNEAQMIGNVSHRQSDKWGLKIKICWITKPKR